MRQRSHLLAAAVVGQLLASVAINRMPGPPKRGKGRVCGACGMTSVIRDEKPFCPNCVHYCSPACRGSGRI